MNLDELKALLQQANEETELAYEGYAKQSATHRVALQIIQFEREMYVGDSSTGHHLKKIKDMIEKNAEDIVPEDAMAAETTNETH